MKEMKQYFSLLNNIIFYSIFFINFPLSNSECGRDSPIYSDNYCQLKYCTKEEFASGYCKIDNQIIKTQWLNNIISFDSSKFRYGCFTLNSEGDMIYICSDSNGNRLFYWLNYDGSFAFEDNGKKVPVKIIYIEGNRYESGFSSVKASNNNEYLLSISLWQGNTEYYDFKNNKFSKILTNDFTQNDVFSYGLPNNIIEIGNKEYLYTFIGRKDEKDIYNNYHFYSFKYTFNGDEINLNNAYSVNKKLDIFLGESHVRMININKISSSCYILFYMEKICNNGNCNGQYIIKLYKDSNNNNELYQFKNSIIENDIAFSEDLFCKSFYIENKKLGVFAYYKTTDGPKIKIIQINKDSSDNTFNEKYDFQLNSPSSLSNFNLLNDLIKINDIRFCLITTNTDKNQLYIILFDFFNSNKNIKERIYNIKLYDLYHYKLYREITSIIYNGFLALSLSVCKSDTCDGNSNFFLL